MIRSPSITLHVPLALSLPGAGSLGLDAVLVVFTWNCPRDGRVKFTEYENTFVAPDARPVVEHVTRSVLALYAHPAGSPLTDDAAAGSCVVSVSESAVSGPRFFADVFTVRPASSPRQCLADRHVGLRRRGGDGDRCLRDVLRGVLLVTQGRPVVRCCR